MLGLKIEGKIKGNENLFSDSMKLQSQIEEELYRKHVKPSLTTLRCKIHRRHGIRL